MKFNIDKEKVKKVFEAYKRKVGEYPTTNDIGRLKVNHPAVPTAKWIQRHGGLIRFYNSLGLYYVDARTGLRRAGVAISSIKKSQSKDLLFSKALVEKFGESNVHWQSPYNKGLTLHRSDFRVYKPDGSFFFIDLFFPKDMDSFQGCVGIKVRKLEKISVDQNAPIFFVSCNDDGATPQHEIDRYISSRKTPLLPNLKLMHIDKAFDFIKML